MKIDDVTAAHTTTRPGDYPGERLPEVAFIGRSNVGKSSLINSLLQRRKLARTSKEPGRTRAIHWYRVVAQEGGCFFVDLPGYGFARVSRQVREQVWARLIETYLRSDRPLVLAVQLLDIRRDGPTALDEQMIEWLRDARIPVCFALTKSDKLSRARRLDAVAAFRRRLAARDEEEVIAYSAQTGEGRRALWSAIDARVRAC